MGFDDVSLATGQVRRALDQVGSERALRQVHVLGLQVHLTDHLVRHLDAVVDAHKTQNKIYIPYGINVRNGK